MLVLVVAISVLSIVEALLVSTIVVEVTIEIVPVLWSSFILWWGVALTIGVTTMATVVAAVALLTLSDTLINQILAQVKPWGIILRLVAHFGTFVNAAVQGILRFGLFRGDVSLCELQMSTILANTAVLPSGRFAVF